VTFHVIGAGLAGLAAAIEAAGLGHRVCLYEAAPQAGGRCRSLDDPKLGRRIDNGSHVLMGANLAALAYLDRIGARASLVRLGQDGIPFVDLADGDRWVFRPGRRVPGAGIADYLRVLRLLMPAGERTVAEVLGEDRLVRRFWAPLAVAALNTPVEEASARLLRRMVWRLLRAGPAGLDLMMAREGLSETFVDPALRRLRDTGGEIRLACRLTGLETDKGQVRSLVFGETAAPLAAADRVILAVPPGAAAGLLPDLIVPTGSSAIVNAHFRVDAAPAARGGIAIVGLCGATAQWLFRRDDVLSATVSAADDLVQQPADAIAAVLGRDAVRALDLGPADLPPYRVVKEKRATLRQNPANDGRRPSATTGLANLFLAGDWTATGLPATLESAIISGHRAVNAAVSFMTEQ
jgi:squalene-associated FAD-dependent desaturase